MTAEIAKIASKPPTAAALPPISDPSAMPKNSALLFQASAVQARAPHDGGHQTPQQDGATKEMRGGRGCICSPRFTRPDSTVKPCENEAYDGESDEYPSPAKRCADLRADCSPDRQ